MKSIAPDAPVEDHQHHWLTWRIAVPVLALLFVFYPAVMPPPPHAGAATFAPVTEAVPMQAHGTDTCPPMEMCGIATIEQALPRLPVPPALLLTFVVILFAVRWQPRPLAARPGWWWPPDRRRALLQVFLI
jgi:hypothetical protein